VHAIYEDHHLHGAAGSRLNARQRMQGDRQFFFLALLVDQRDGEQSLVVIAVARNKMFVALEADPFSRRSTISAGENFLVDVDGGALSVHDVTGVGVDHGFDARRAVLLGTATTPRRCSYARASMTAASREHGYLRATSVQSGLPRPVMKSLICCPSFSVRSRHDRAMNLL
jgi:hypothetical protein